MKTDEIEILIENLKNMELISEEDGFRTIAPYIEKIILYILNLIKIAPTIEMPEKNIKILKMQIENIKVALENKDIICLYDTIKYEAVESVQVYYDIIKEL